MDYELMFLVVNQRRDGDDVPIHLEQIEIDCDERRGSYAKSEVVDSSSSSSSWSKVNFPKNSFATKSFDLGVAFYCSVKCENTFI